MRRKHDTRPEALQGMNGDPTTRKERTEERFTYFWSGPFSQWHRSSFTVGTQSFSHAEQFMMHSKALLFGDHSTAAKILASKNPRDQKALGRSITGFSDEVWTLFRVGVVFTATYAKFSQNSELRQELLRTDGTTMVEASPLDVIWGIGLAEDNPLARNRSTWRGLNLLGETLTRVRSILLAENSAGIPRIELAVPRIENE